MEAGAIAARLVSSAVVPLVKKLFRQDGPGAGLVDQPVRVSALVSFRGERRTLDGPQLHKLAEELVQRAVRGAPPGERPVPEGEEHAVAEALAASLQALGELELEDVQAVRLGHREFARLLREREPSQVRALSADAAYLHQGLLEAASLHILHFFTQRSTFVQRTLVEHSRQLAETDDKVDLLLERLPAPSVEDVRFERRYRDFVSAKHATLTIYGLDLQHSREWPLDTAYLSLAATGPEERGSLLPDAGPLGADPAAHPADRLFAQHERVLLRGVAGSGKTTLVQWLAVTAARQDTAPGPTELLGRVPFVLPLRTLTRGGAELPLPERFLAASGCPLSGAEPSGWVDRVLTAGRGLLLVDGIDEVPEPERAPARRWLGDLLLAFPGNLCLVTSRPSAVRPGWLSTEGFAELSLARMGRAEVAEFLHRWHRAAEAGPELEQALLAEVRAKQDLGRLATNPLMCGLICALHRERRGFLPRGRKALYDAALSMLLERRERERVVPRADGIQLDLESQTELLQKLAYWLIRNGRAEMEQSDAIDLLGRVLPAMPQASAQGSAAEIFRHLLERSGLLREPGHGAVDFVHRTFQDFLGAREAIEERDLDLLVRHAHLDQWEDVLRMAVAHARPDERARLLRGLLTRGDDEPDVRTRLYLLATACLEHATKLDPAVREEVEQRAAALIPPRSYDEAKALAEVGPVVLDLLPGPAGLADDEAQAVVHTACQLGGDAALPLVTRFREHEDAGVRAQLGSHWDRFDTESYGREIIGHLNQGTTITVRTPEQLVALKELGGGARVSLGGDFPPAQITDALDPERLEHLEIFDNARVAELGFLVAFPHLRSLALDRCALIEDLSAVRNLPVRELRLWRLTGLRGLAGLRTLDQLEQLVVGRAVSCRELSWLPQAPRLWWLTLTGEADLTGIEAWQGLRSLSLPSESRQISADEWRSLAAIPKLETLLVSPEQLSPIASLPRLAHLYVDAKKSLCDLSLLPRLFPALEHFELQRQAEVDLAPLAELPHLRHVHLYQTQRVRNADRLPPQVELHRLPRPRTESPPSIS